ncbi:hypothetical protein EXIGLDRAFT_764437 [Exidia glandulosa HHB12029]|uniref:DNA2/NAM7 helicase-like C-terminal domain-containing protein n=1 Tax=Exidia glandulosa HHB12029 TaxID=1314781 RepID=A0A165L7V6_EXIGL|nr:hypothetical protein EXIGLDRAFT_764437 [Exidia glandulosa HHB12029]
MGLTGLQLPEGRKMSTVRLPLNDLKTIAKIHRDAVLLDAKKPKMVKNEIADEWTLNEKGDMLRVASERFSTRLRPGERQVVQITDDTGAIIEGVVTKVTGRTAIIALPEGTTVSAIQGVHTVGKDALTQAERSKDAILVKALEGAINLTRLKTFRAIWFPSFRTTSRPRAIPEDAITIPLNDSQKQAVNTILRDPLKGEVDVQIIVGPPGSGKTSVIGACVQAIMASATIEQPRYVWLAAQSNVAVKNIARKLVKMNFTDFRLLVSNEFFFDWHEHLYLQVHDHMICSKDFPKKSDEAAEKLGGVRVILCTLSMLSHPNLPIFSNIVPIETLIIDEASQIELGDFVPVLCQYSETVRKLVFVGDDMQLAPFGQDDIRGLQSVFEIGNLRKRAEPWAAGLPFLLGRFFWIQFSKGRLGFDPPNIEECEAAIDVARILHAEEKDYRIITPYDAQRAEVEMALKRSGLPWPEKVFNVDSFQGNEAPFIIVTVVRTEGIGFLRNARRTNVMLSRCQAGLIIVSNQRFLTSRAWDTLVGRMAHEWGMDAWVGARRIKNGSLEPGEDPEVIERSVPSSSEDSNVNANDWGGNVTEGYVDWSSGEPVELGDWSVPPGLEPHATTVRDDDWSVPSPRASARGRGGKKAKSKPVRGKVQQRSTPAAVDDSDWSQPGGVELDWSQPGGVELDWSSSGNGASSSHDQHTAFADGSFSTSGADVESSWSSSTGSDHRGQRGRGRIQHGQPRARGGRGRGRGRGSGSGSQNGHSDYRGRDGRTKELEAFT